MLSKIVLNVVVGLGKAIELWKGRGKQSLANPWSVCAAWWILNPWRGITTPTTGAWGVAGPDKRAG